MDELNSQTPETVEAYFRFTDEQVDKALLPTRDLVFFPGAILPLTVMRPSSIASVECALKQDIPILVIAQKNPEIESPKRRDVYDVGTICRIVHSLKLSNGNYSVILQGLERARITKVISSKPFYRVATAIPNMPVGNAEENKRLLVVLRDQLRQLLELNPQLPRELFESIIKIEDDFKFADTMAFHLNLPVPDRQALLESSDVTSQLLSLAKHAAKQIELAKLDNKIREKAEHEMDKYQRDFYLHEQLRAIQEELGEGDLDSAEVEQLRADITAANMPEKAQEHALRELRKMERMPSSSPDRAILQNYLEWIVRFPWSKSTEDQLDLTAAQASLDEDHFGLKDVKERILEFLAVHKMKQDHHGPILCLVGPPGVGKTSVGRSIARTLGRKFNRTSLGGVHDEAEIRGHRRTYIGALPGRIIQAMCTAESNNPVIMLDEIDKIGKDYRGDPAAALLEALDPEQNGEFKDHYVSVPVDLSKTMFILTANVTDTIPPALLDRMEIIRISGYTAEEKLEIADKFLLPRALERHGLSSEQLSISREVLQQVIKEYTREAGVRTLEREISALCRKRVRQIVEEHSEDKSWPELSSEEMHTFLGVPRYSDAQDTKWTTAGSVHGLSWTQVGGEILNIEANVMPGKGRLMLTGNLGDVMKESARAAITWVRGYLHRQKIDFEYYKNDIHIHVPEGAIPKDGPSAGVTLACAFASAVTGKVVSPNLAMTGEITLTGKVLAVGGIKEKMLAAYNNEVYQVFLPAENEKNLEDIPEEIRSKMKFTFVKHIDELFAEVFK